MANYIETATSSYPFSEGQIKAENPNTSFPTPFSAEGFAVVFLTPQPAYDWINQGVREIAPTYTAPNYYQAWEVYALSQDQIDANTASNKQLVFQDIRTGTENRLDTFAQGRLYIGISALATYAGSAIPKYQVEASDGITGRDATWATVEQIVADVIAGTRPLPSGYAEIEPELPPLAWTAPATNVSF